MNVFPLLPTVDKLPFVTAVQRFRSSIVIGISFASRGTDGLHFQLPGHPGRSLRVLSRPAPGSPAPSSPRSRIDRLGFMPAQYRNRWGRLPILLSLEEFYSWWMIAENSLYGGAAPALLVRSEGTDRSLSPGPAYLVGRDPDSDIVISDGRISWQHAVLRFADGRWVLADNASTNGTYVNGQRIDQIDIVQECQVRLGHPADGALLTCTVSRADRSARPGG